MQRATNQKPVYRVKRIKNNWSNHYTEAMNVVAMRSMSVKRMNRPRSIYQ